MDPGCGNRWANPPHRRHAVEHRGFITGWIQPAVLLCATALALSFCSSKSNEPTPVIIKQIYYTPAWSPDGREIVCQLTRIDDSSNSTYFTAVVDAATGVIVRERALDFPPPFAFSWTPDGKWLLFGASPGIFKMSFDLTEVIQLTSGESQTCPTYSRARDLVFFAENGAVVGGLFSVTLNGDSLRRWSTAETTVYQTFCFPDSSDSLIGYRYSDGARMVAFTPDRIAEALSLDKRLQQQFPCRVSLSHRYIAYNDTGDVPPFRSIWLLDRSTNTTRKLITGTGEELDFSPDDSKLVYPILAGKEVGLWILDVATGERRRLTDGTQ